MKMETVDVAMALAQRFVALAKKVKERGKVDSGVMFGCKETGALRRSSMELTRILAELRQGK